MWFGPLYLPVVLFCLASTLARHVRGSVKLQISTLKLEVRVVIKEGYNWGLQGGEARMKDRTAFWLGI